MDAKLRESIQEAMATSILSLASNPKADGSERWAKGPEGKTYQGVAHLGQVHVNYTHADKSMSHYGFAISVYDYGEPKTKTAMGEQIAEKDKEIAELKALLEEK